MTAQPGREPPTFISGKWARKPGPAAEQPRQSYSPAAGCRQPANFGPAGTVTKIENMF